MKTIVTHNGPFHADEVFACEVIRWIVPEAMTTLRTRNAQQIAEADYVVDVGGVYSPHTNQFDHHQADDNLPCHPEGPEMASFGQVWASHGKDFVHAFLYGRSYFHGEGTKPPDEMLSFIAERIRKTLVLGIDMADMGAANNDTLSVSGIIAGMRPLWNEDCSFDEGFWKARRFVGQILRRQVKSAKAAWEAKEVWENAPRYNNGQIVVLPQYIPWQGMPMSEKLLYVVFPTTGGEYRVQQTPKEPGSFAGRKPLPEAWVDTPPTQATFVHKGRFIAGAPNEKAALEMAAMAVEA